MTTSTKAVYIGIVLLATTLQVPTAAEAAGTLGVDRRPRLVG